MDFAKQEILESVRRIARRTHKLATAPKNGKPGPFHINGDKASKAAKRFAAVDALQMEINTEIRALLPSSDSNGKGRPRTEAITSLSDLVGLADEGKGTGSLRRQIRRLFNGTGNPKGDKPADFNAKIERIRDLVDAADAAAEAVVEVASKREKDAAQRASSWVRGQSLILDSVFGERS